MIWASWSDFWNMGGYGLYVWGSYGVVALGLFRALQGGLGEDLSAFKLPGFVRELLVAVTVVMYGGFWLSIVSLRYTQISIATALAGTEPILVLPLLQFWLRERVRPAAWGAALVGVVGVGLIVTGCQG